jgi:hypothetical protein
MAKRFSGRPEFWMSSAVVVGTSSATTQLATDEIRATAPAKSSGLHGSIENS